MLPLPPKEREKFSEQCGHASQPRGPPRVFRSTWCKPVCGQIPGGKWTPEAGKGDRWFSMISACPGLAPTSSWAPCNYLLPKPHLSLLLSPCRTWGSSVSPNLPSAYLRQRFARTRTLQARTPTLRQITEEPFADTKPQCREVHKWKATYFAGYAFQRLPFEMPVSDNEKKKNPKSCSSTKWAKPGCLPPPAPGGQRSPRVRAEVGAQRDPLFTQPGWAAPCRSLRPTPRPPGPASPAPAALAALPAARSEPAPHWEANWIALLYRGGKEPRRSHVSLR